MISAYLQPANLDEALVLVAKGATAVGGATGLFSARSLPSGNLVDVTRIGLGTIAVEANRIVLGATVTLAQIADRTDLPGPEGALLRHAAGTVASRPLRCAVTLGGNIAHPAYWADMPVVLLALDAGVAVQHSREKPRVVPLSDCLAPGRPPWEGGLITSVLVPRRPGSWGFGHERFARTVTDYSFATACTMLRRDGTVAREVRVVMGALQGRPFRVSEVEALVEGKAFDAALLEHAAAKLRATVRVAPNFRVSEEYRRDLAAILAHRALAAAFARAGGKE